MDVLVQHEFTDYLLAQTGGYAPPEPPPAPPQPEPAPGYMERSLVQRLLEMVVEGRISALDALSLVKGKEQKPIPL